MERSNVGWVRSLKNNRAEVPAESPAPDGYDLVFLGIEAILEEIILISDVSFERPQIDEVTIRHRFLELLVLG